MGLRRGDVHEDGIRRGRVAGRRTEHGDFGRFDILGGVRRTDIALRRRRGGLLDRAQQRREDFHAPSDARQTH